MRSLMVKRGLHASSPARMKVIVPVKRVVDYAVKVRGVLQAERWMALGGGAFFSLF